MNLKKNKVKHLGRLLIDSPRLRVFESANEFLITERNAIALGGDCFVDYTYSVARN
jgi:hypothetical protein